MRGGRTNYDLGGFGVVIALAIGAPLLVGGLLLALIQFLIPIAVIALIVWVIWSLMSPSTVTVERPTKPITNPTKPKVHQEKFQTKANTSNTEIALIPKVADNVDKIAQSDISSDLITPSVPATPLKDINTVTYQELLQFYGIGTDLTSKVIGFRNRNKRIDDINSLLQVPGIGQYKLNLLKCYLYVANNNSIDK